MKQNLLDSRYRDFNTSYHINKKNFNPLHIQKKFRHIDLEIGCGVGWHPITRAQNYPSHYVIGIEKTKEKFSKFYRRFLNHKSPQNLKAVNQHAVSWITQNFSQTESVDHIFLLYPNPYPKKSDRKKRWYNTPFMKYLISILKKEGCFTLASNEKWYVTEFEEALQELGMYTSSYRVLSKIEIDRGYKPRTHFEKKYLLDNIKCYDLTFHKKIEV